MDDAMRCYCGEWVATPHVECLANYAPAVTETALAEAVRTMHAQEHPGELRHCTHRVCRALKSE